MREFLENASDEHHRSGFIAAYLEHGVPVLIAHAGRYPNAALPGGLSTRDEPHVLVSIGGHASISGTATTRGFTSVTVAAMSRYVNGYRRMLPVASRSVPMEQGTDTAESWVLEGETHLTQARAILATIDATYEAMQTRVAVVEQYPRLLSREDYEAACRECGARTLTDEECDSYGVRYGNFCFPQYTPDHIVEMGLAYRRLLAMDQARETAPKPTPTPVSWKWGARGTRYDEACEHCGKISEVDNVHGCCSAHHAAGLTAHGIGA
jgi:hypothetical protein